jgi:nicotinamide-nucleotide amidase
MNRNKKVNNFIKTLLEEGYTLALAESMTCGLASHFLSTCKGTANVLLGSIVCYTPAVKTKLLGVPATAIERYSAESKEVTRLLAANLHRKIRADICAAITGLASAGGSETKQKPVGTVFFSILFRGRTYNFRTNFRGTPLEIREKACLHLYDKILETIGK